MKEFDEVEILKQLKKEKGYTYKQLGEELGVHYRTVYLWLAGKTKPSPLARKIIRNYLMMKL